MASAVTFLWYTATGAIGLLLLHHVVERGLTVAPSVALPWLPVGVGVASLLYLGRQAWPGVFLASCVVWGVIQGDSWAPTLIDAVGETLSIVLIVTLLRSWGFRSSFDRMRDPLLLLAAVAIGRLLSSGLDLAADIVAAWLTSDPDKLAALRAAGVEWQGHTLRISAGALAYSARWFANAMTGCMLVVPLLALVTSSPRRQPPDRVRLLLLGAAVVLWLLCAMALPAAVLRPAILLGGLLLVVWAAARFGVGIAAAVTLVLTTACTVGFGLQLGTFEGLESREGLEVAWGFIGLLSGTALFLTTLLSQRERARRAIAASGLVYRRLFLGNPFPMWARHTASGRIVLVNPAALRLYGYDEQQFLRLPPAELRADTAATAPAAGGEPLHVTVVERHRTAFATEIEVEVTRVPTLLDGEPAMISFIEPLSERNELRLAALSAGDIERYRTGGTIHDQLMPRLARVVESAGRLADTATDDGRSAGAILTTIAENVDAAIAICRQLTRGASPLDWAGGSLAEALRRLPASLPEGSPAVEVTVHESASLSLSVERSDHVYRLAEDAVRAAAARPGVRTVRIALEVSSTNLRVRVEDDGAARTFEGPQEAVALRSINARAIAAEGHLRVGPAPSAGTAVTFETELGDDAEPPGHAAPAADAPGPPPAEPGDRTGAARQRSRGASWLDWLHQSAHLGIAYTATAVLGFWFLQEIDSLHLSAHGIRAVPWVAGGVAIVGLWIGGARLWPAVFVGYVLVWRGLAHEGWLTVLIAAAAQAAGAVLTVSLMRRLHFRQAFDRYQDIALLFFAAAVGRALVIPADLLGLQFPDAISPLNLSAEMRTVLGDARAVLFGFSAAQWSAVLRWWLNGVTGIVLVVPALVSWSRRAWDHVVGRGWEFLVWSLTLALTVTTILTVAQPEWRLPILLLGLAVVTWAAVRFGAGPASTATLVLAMTATASHALATGLLAPARPDEGQEVLWGFIVVLATTAHVLTALLAEGDRAAVELEQLKLQYRNLFEAVPHPLFVYSTESGRIRLANHVAIREYGYTAAEFATMSLADLDADPRDDRPAADLSRPLRIAARHRTKSGEIRDLELALTPVEIDDEPGALCFAIDVSERNRLRTRMIEATDRERRHLAREFHDGLGQVLTGLQLGMAPLRRAAAAGRPLDDKAVRFVATAAAEARRACEQILRGVSALQDADGDLLDAIRRLPERLPPGADVRLDVAVTQSAAITLPLEQREHLYQIAQEAVTNALKHARASRITVTMTVKPADLKLVVEDDGIGFDPAHDSTGLGLNSLRLRATALRGRLRISRRLGGGTVVTVVGRQVADATGRS